MNSPLLICLTSTRNYGWVTGAFLKANSLWADYIIMVDQMSTDGTREMAINNPKVILLDNEDMSYSETKRSEMAINRAREIEGDKILIYLAIDEVLSANYFETNDWERILNSKPGDVFCMYWANLISDKKHFFSMNQTDGSTLWMARIFHDDGVTPYDNEGLDMHTHCIPYPKENVKEFYVNDFTILHFSFFSEKWNIAKQRFYQFVDFDKNKRSIIKLSRMYKRPSNWEIKEIPKSWIYNETVNNFNLFDEVNTDNIPILDYAILDFIKSNGIMRYRKLNVWDDSFLKNFKINDPRNQFDKIIHFYLNTTSNHTNNIFIRVIDKILKKIGL